MFMPLRPAAMQKQQLGAMLGLCLSKRRWVKTIKAHVRKEGSPWQKKPP